MFRDVIVRLRRNKRKTITLTLYGLVTIILVGTRAQADSETPPASRFSRQPGRLSREGLRKVGPQRSGGHISPPESSPQHNTAPGQAVGWKTVVRTRQQVADS